jgi:diguanylate cyclase (GGDEF)-like protein/putative nucleotidyltransferase with HDIG domain
MSPVGFLMTTGLASIVLADFLFDYKTLHNTYVPGTPLDSAWTFGYMMVALAGYTVSGKEGCADDLLEADDLLSNKTLFSANKQYQSTLTEWRPLFVQYAVVFEIAFLLWLGFHFGADDRLQAGVCVGAAAVFILLLVRQYFMICENKQLTSRLLEFSENLEAVVDVRTQELALQTSHILALHTLTAAINETLDEGKVLNTAVEQIGYVFEAEAVAVWLASGNSGTDLLPQAYAGAKEDSDLFQKAGRCELLERCHSQQISVVEGAGREISFEYLQVPLRSRGITFGKIGVIRYLTDYTGPEIALLDSMSSYVATAFDNAKQYWNAREAADQDPVTAVMNHRAIHEYLDTAIELDTSFDEPLTVILADIDNFHLFNNTYGHPVGDDVLRKIGQILDRALVAPCKVGRYRGDEFIIVLPGLAGDLAINLAQRLQCLISDLELHYGDDDRSIPASMSYGVASFPADSADKQELLVTASRNLQTAKTSEDHIFALSNLQRAHHELRVGSSFRMLDGMVTAVDNKDSYTRKHSEDVTEYALWIAEEMGLSDEDKHLLRAGGLLHDVGKIGVPDEILRKPGRLTDEEYTIMKQHPTLGALIVGGVPDMEGIIDIVRHHHEQWDGAGYPNGLAGEDIPFNARVMAIADAMSAMTTDRPYRKGLSFDTAIERIRKGMGTQFDPTLAATFLQAAYKRHSPENKCPALEQELRKAA